VASAEEKKLLADLSAYLDGELGPERARQVEAFLAHSEEARRTLDQLRTISAALRALPRVRAPGHLAESVQCAAERQALLSDRPAAGRQRVLRLVAQISASAAVIVACVVAGWTVLNRLHGLPSAEHSGALVRGMPPAGVPRSGTAERVRADDSGQPESLAVAVGESAGEEVAVGAERQPEAAEELALVTARAERGPAAPAITADLSTGARPPLDTDAVGAAAIASGHPGQPGALPGALVSAQAAPVAEINIVVTPRTVSEYDAARRTVASWQQAVAGQTPAGAAAQAEPGVGAEREGTGAALAGALAPSSPPTQQEYVLNVPAARFGAVLRALDEQAPGQVLANVNFNARQLELMQRIVAAPEVPETAGAVPPVQAASDSVAPQQQPLAPAQQAVAPGHGQQPVQMYTLGRTAPPPGPRAGSVLRVPAREAGAPTRTPVKTESPAEAAPAGKGRGASGPAPAAAAGAPFATLQPADKDDASALRPGSGRVGPEAQQKTERFDEQRQPRVEDVARGRVAARAPDAAPGQTPARPPQTPGAPAQRGVTAPPLDRQVRSAFARIRSQVRQACELMLGVSFGPAPGQAPQQPVEAGVAADQEPIMLRVTLLPPPAAPPDSSAAEAAPTPGPRQEP